MRLRDHCFLAVFFGATTASGFVTSPPGIRSVLTSRFSAKVDAPPGQDGAALNNEADADEEKEQFNWFKAWYPLVPVEMLDPEIPHRYQLLGMDLVVWKDAAIEGGTFGSKKKRSKKAKRVGGEWRVFVDECPHRKVPLSEGRVEDDGTLLCSYHAFRFDGKGDCVDVPQISKQDGFDLVNVQKNPKSRCNSFPAQIIDGVLWVWPETGGDARLESALTEARCYKTGEGVDPDRVWVGNWNYRELPYSADYFIENVVDPAHVQVSHHGIVGSRYGDLNLAVERNKPLTTDGFSAKVTTNEVTSTTTFEAPGLVAIEAPFGDGAKQTLELYVSPSRPGFCNHVGRVSIIKDKSGKTPALLRQFTVPMPKWLNHVLAASFLNQDAVFLHYQERQLAKTGAYVSSRQSESSNYGKNMFLIKADYGVSKYRTWLSRLAGGYIPYKNGGLIPEANRDVCFDQYNSHTSKCQICQAALSNFKKVRLASFIASICLAVLRPAPKQAINLVGVLATAGLGFGVNSFIQKFYKNEFSHSHND